MINHKISFIMICLVFRLSCPVLFAQVSKPLRIEFPVEKESEPVQLLVMENQNILLFYLSQSNALKDHVNWNFSLLDVNLHVKWTKTLSLKPEFEYKFSAVKNDTVLVGFQNSGRKGNQSKLLYFVIDIARATTTEIADEIPEKLQVVMGRYFSGFLFLGLNDKNDHLQVRMKKLTADAVVIVKQEDASKTVLQDIKPIAASDGFRLVFENFTSRKESVIVVSDYGFDGKPKNAVRLDVSTSQNVLNAVRLIELENGSKLVLGAYSNQKSKTVEESQNRAEESTGMFGGLLQEEGFVSQNFYNFLDFKNFFNRMRADQAIYQNKNLNKEKEISSDYRLLLHNILCIDDSYLLVAEAYYPEYHTVTNWSYDYYGHMIPNYYTVFDGYRYNNVFVCGFDSTGTLLWDNSMEINNILSNNLKQRVAIYQDGKELIMAYLSEGKIASKVIYHDQTLDGIEYYPVENLDKHDRVITNEENLLIHWYDQYFIACGIQEIKNLNRTDTRRNVFYINKIAFR